MSSATELSEQVIEITRAYERLEAELLRVVGTWDEHEAWAADGALNPQSWLAHRTPLTRSRAFRLVRAARLAKRHARTGAALASGEISASHVDVLARVAHQREQVFERDEGALLDAATDRSPESFTSIAQQWRCTADAELAHDDANDVQERRRLRLIHTLHGSTEITGELDPEGGELLAAALDKVDTGPDPVDGALRPRTLEQRRADALVTLASRQLNTAGGSPRVYATLDALIDPEVLSGRPPTSPFGETLLSHVGPVPPDVVRRLACDAAVGRVVSRGKSQILDLGRRTRVVNGVLRRALAIRDGGCAFPGCDRPEDWCDAHHLVHWADGGATDLDNLVLLCRRHHIACHEGGFILVRGPTGAWEAYGRRDLCA